MKPSSRSGGGPGGAPGAGTVEDFERRFRRAGLPLFIDGYSAAEHIFTRAIPFLSVVFAAEIILSVDPSWSLLATIVAIPVGALIVVGALAALNRARGQPLRSLPTRVGAIELGLFIAGPAIVQVTFGFDATSVLGTIALNLVILATTYLIVGFGLLSILRWAVMRAGKQIASSLGLLARALPMFLVLLLLMSMSPVVWVVASTRPGAALRALVVLFVLFGSIFILASVPREVAALEEGAGGDAPPLSRRQRVNVGLVMFVSQYLQVIIVVAGVGLIFLVVGAIALGTEIPARWVGRPLEVVFTVRWPGLPIAITRELLRVSAGIAAFAGLYFSTAVFVDFKYRKQFLEDLTAEMKASFEERAAYLKLLGHPNQRPPASGRR